MDLHRKKLPLRFGQQLKVQLEQQETYTYRRSADKHCPYNHRIVETGLQAFLIRPLQPVKELVLHPFYKIQFLGLAHADITEREIRRHPCSIEDTGY